VIGGNNVVASDLAMPCVEILIVRLVLAGYYSFRPKINNIFDSLHIFQCTTLVINIFNYLLLKI
jgi:hypothetical protein